MRKLVSTVAQRGQITISAEVRQVSPITSVNQRLDSLPDGDGKKDGVNGSI